MFIENMDKSRIIRPRSGSHPDSVLFIFYKHLTSLRSVLSSNHKPAHRETCTCNKKATTMKILLSTILILSLTLYLSAQQTFQWGVRAGGESTDVINDITSQGDDIYVTGRFSGQFVSGNETADGEGMTDIYLLKLDKKGNTVWLRSLAGEGANNASCIATQEKNIFVGGTISGSVRSEKDRFNGNGTALFVSSWNEKGKVNWLVRLPYSGHATLDVLEIAPDGSLLAGGLLQGTLEAGDKKLKCPGEKRAWSVAFSASGDPSEATLSSGKGSHRLVSAAFDKEFNLYRLFSVSGDFSIDRDTTVVFPRSMKTGLVITKTNKAGNTDWIKTLRGTGYNEGVKILAGKTNELVVCANFNDELKLQDTILSTDSQLEAVLLAFDTSGGFKWVKTILSPVKARAMDVLFTRHGNILVSGYFRTSYVVNGEHYSTDVTGGNIFLLQLNSKGEPVWHDEPGREVSGFCKAFTLDKTGNVIFAGGFRGELALQDDKLKSAGKEDILIAKYFNCLQKEAKITGECTLCPGGETELTVSGDFSTYLWNENEWGENRLVVSEPGVYRVTAFDRQGCAASDTVEVVVLKNGSTGLPPEVELHPGERIILSAESGYAFYRWDDGTETAQREISYAAELDSALLHLAAETFNGCLVTDSVTVRFRHEKNRAVAFNAFAEAWPNPVNDNLSWFVRTEKPTDVTVILTDSRSVTVYSRQFKGYTPHSVKSIDMSGLAGGSYLLNIRAGDMSYQQKIIKK